MTDTKNDHQNKFPELERGVHAALETYANVHRGSGHNSVVSTYLYEQARDIVLDHLGLDKGRYVVIFCTPRREAALKALLKSKDYHIVSSLDTGLPLGIRAVAVKKRTLPKGVPFQTGGGTTRLVSPEWVVWADAPDRFEAGTPAIINVIAFARALLLIRQYGKDIFLNKSADSLRAQEILYHDELDNYSGSGLLNQLRQTLIGRTVLIPTTLGPRPYIHLDNSASTPTFMPVWEAVRQTWHQTPEVQQEINEEVRSLCAGFLGAPSTDYDIIFTINTTEAINLAAESLSRNSEQDTEPVLLATLLEHSSNDLPWRFGTHFPLIRLSIDSEGFVNLEQLDSVLNSYNQACQHGKKRIRLVAVCGASNVLGVFNDMAEISRIAHQYGARLLVDAAQMVAHRKVDMEECCIDYLAFSAHKVYAPFGSGVLVVRKGLLNYSPDEMEMIRHSGEENAGGIAALGKAIVLLRRIGMDLIIKEEQALTAHALHGLAQVPGLTIYGIKDPNSPRFDRKGGVISFVLKGMLSPRVARELAEKGGIGIRCGCHCAHILVKHLVGVPPALEWFQRLIAILIPWLRFPGIARVSVGIGNSESDIDMLIQTLGRIVWKSGDSVSHPKTGIQRQIDDFAKAAARRVYSEG
jgi:selenocysteine lyase/cysteine desulfurase